MQVPMPHFGEFAALLTAMFWTVSVISFENAGKRVGSLPVNLLRLVQGFVFLTIYCAVVRDSWFPFDAPDSAWIYLTLSGIAGFLIGDLSLFRAFVLIGGRLSMLIYSLVPVLTAVISWIFLGETLTMLDMIAMAITIGGVSWVVSERKRPESGADPGNTARGILLALAGTVGQSVGFVLSKKGMGAYDAFAASQIRILSGMLAFVVLFTVIGWWPKVFSALKDRTAMLQTVVGSVFGPFLGATLSLVAVKYTETGVAATIMTLVPVFIIPPAILIQKEKVSLRAVFGALVAVSGSVILFQ